MLYGVAYSVLALVLKAVWGLEMMSGGDELFFQEDPRNCCNIVAFHRYSRFNGEQMAKVMVQRACQFPRLKSKIVKFLGKYMFEE